MRSSDKFDFPFNWIKFVLKITNFYTRKQGRNCKAMYKSRESREREIHTQRFILVHS